MAIFKCKMCGGDLNITEGLTVAECEYCGTKQTVPSADNEKKITLFRRANKLRVDKEFDMASGVYESIVVDFPEEAEAYWGLILCRYGIEYVDDPATAKKIPTCHRSSFNSVLDDSDYQMVMKYADVVAKNVYIEEANQIEELRKSIIEVSGKEDPYDIFICYKETDERGERTEDSEIAQNVYDALTEKGYRVFFSRITLEDKLGREYEPYIFKALNSAKIMLAFGTKPEYFDAVWVKNEWSRYLQLMTSDKTKLLIPCYKGITIGDMPNEFTRLQAQDFGKIGAIQDLLRGVEKILPRQKAEQVQQSVPFTAATSTPDSMLRRAFLYLEDGEWQAANNYCEKVLDITPENGMAYLGKLMVSLKIRTQDELATITVPFDDNPFYAKVMRFGDDKLIDSVAGANCHGAYTAANRLLEHAATVDDCINAFDLFSKAELYCDCKDKFKECLDKGNKITYDNACHTLDNAWTADDCHTAMSAFAKLEDYADSPQKLRQCEQRLNGIVERYVSAISNEVQNKTNELAKLKKNKQKNRNLLFFAGASVALAIISVIIVVASSVSGNGGIGIVVFLILCLVGVIGYNVSVIMMMKAISDDGGEGFNFSSLFSLLFGSGIITIFTTIVDFIGLVRSYTDNINQCSTDINNLNYELEKFRRFADSGTLPHNSDFAYRV